MFHVHAPRCTCPAYVCMMYTERTSDVPAATDCIVRTVASALQASADAQGTSAEENCKYACLTVRSIIAYIYIFLFFSSVMVNIGNDQW